MTIDRPAIRRALQTFDFRALFIEVLGWDHYQGSLTVPVGSASFALHGVAQKRGVVVLALETEAIPPHGVRGKIESQVARSHRENFIIFTDRSHTQQVWLWTRREPGRPLSRREGRYHSGQSGEALAQKLAQIAFSLEEEEEVGLVEVIGRVRAAFDVERTTRRFYDDFRRQRDAFEQFVRGIPDVDLTKWYVSVMLNRLMFVYFIQKKGFLDGDPDYLRHRLEAVQAAYGDNQFDRFYRYFLLRLFHDGLGRPDHDAELERLIGRVPYLNGGIFQLHAVEAQHPDIQIADAAFENIFTFFDRYQWHLDDRPLRNDTEINPDVLGYIFEKYINQKQMGAYYTKEDITDYIGKNTIIPFLFDEARQGCAVAFSGEESVWALAAADPDRYVYPAVRKGVELDLPPEIAAGVDDVAARGVWNRPAGPEHALPTEIWRETVARRQRYEEVRAKLAGGEVSDINDFITLNLDIRQFAQDVIDDATPELLRAFWDALRGVSVLDPTCGSGAFLFAALNILEPLYEGCLERMRLFVEEPGWTKLHPRYAETFGRVLADMARHPSPTYYITKAIIVNNLYGVDIMAEAAEIAKLRLFLKLAALVARVEDVEPLPDIDFNIRAGNTLVGYARREEVRAALAARPVGAGVQQTQMIFGEQVDDLRRVEEAAADADRLYAHFRAMQTGGEAADFDAADFAATKAELQHRLAALNGELDRALARQYGIDPDAPAAFARWRETHQPFHWFSEFYGILHGGGFDVVIGNPPYVQTNQIRGYEVKGYDTESCGDLYAYVLERSQQLSNRASTAGFIVPMGAFSVSKFEPLQRLILNNAGTTYISNWSGDAHPSTLFQGVNKRLAIVLTIPKGTGSRGGIVTSRYQKWYTLERGPLFEVCPMHYQISDLTGLAFFHSSVPKLSSQFEGRILAKLRKLTPAIGQVGNQNGTHKLYYTRKVSFFLQFLDFVPEVRDHNGQLRSPSELKELCFDTARERDICLAALSSSLFYWYFIVNSDCRNLNKREVIAFPVPSSLFSDEVGARLRTILDDLMQSYQEHSEPRTVRYAGVGDVTVQYFDFRHSKPILDILDVELAKYYDLEPAELDFILNYDIKYRMGEALGGEGEDG